jgi:hypothetical protein
VAEPLAKADPRGKKRMTRSREPHPRPPSCRRHNPQRLDDARVDADPFEGGAQAPELDRLVGRGTQVLQGAAAAHSELPAWRIGAFWPRSQPIDDAALAPPAAPRAQPGPDTIARHRKRQEDRLAPVLRDAVTPGAEALDRKLDKLVGRQLLLLTHHRRPVRWPIQLAGEARNSHLNPIIMAIDGARWRRLLQK